MSVTLTDEQIATALAMLAKYPSSCEYRALLELQSRLMPGATRCTAAPGAEKERG